VRTLAPFLNAVVRYQPEQQTLAISPYLTVSCQQRPDGGVTVLARSTAPVQFTSKTLADPPRAYLDFKHVSLGNTEPQIDIQAGGVQRLRLAQYSTQPDTVRVVVDFETMRTLKTTVTDAGRQVALEIGADAPPAAPMPGLETPAAPAAPVAEPPANAPRLFDVALESLSPQQSQLTLGTRGEPAVTGSYDAKTRVLTLRAPAAVSTIPDAHLAALSDKLIKSVAVRESTPAGVEVVVTFARDYGYLITRDATGVRVLIGVFDLGDMTVVLDAGHGGYDSGAVGRKGTCEKDINLDIILRTAKLLREAGVKVVLSRSDDTFIPLPERSKLANSRQVDLFISVHCNSTPTRNSQSGTQVYYRTPQSIRLAEAMMTELAEGIKLKRGGVRNGNFHVIRETKMPSVLIETAFINNDVEEELLCQPEFR